MGTAVTLDVESNINISNNSHVAGITLEQNDTTNTAYKTGATQWDNTITVNDSTVTSGSWTEDSEQQDGHFGNSAEPSDYSGDGRVGYHSNDNALEFIDDSSSDYRMVNNVTFNNSQLMGDVYFQSTAWNNNFDYIGHPTDTDSNVYTHGGWIDDRNVDHLTLTLNHTKWVGGAYIDYAGDDIVTPDHFYDVAANSWIQTLLTMMVGTVWTAQLLPERRV